MCSARISTSSASTSAIHSRSGMTVNTVSSLTSMKSTAGLMRKSRSSGCHAARLYVPSSRIEMQRVVSRRPMTGASLTGRTSMGTTAAARYATTGASPMMPLSEISMRSCSEKP